MMYDNDADAADDDSVRWCMMMMTKVMYNDDVRSCVMVLYDNV